ncbi:MAG: hypothetical protein J2P37_18085 [Ktedonobacteraceae bacterium]|nr:hypothetical protein [Ktedonobacteraceae bacterium]MBO0792320.1 hypothetical protein [Ktedonobacteraceae bacterium]
MQHMSLLDPNQVIEQVWRGDYPASWRVFVGEQVNSAGNCLVALLTVIVALLFCILTSGIIVVFLDAIRQGGFPSDNYLAIAVFALLLTLVIFGWKAIKRYSSRQPKPMIVVLPDGVVGYRRRKKVWAIAFADVAHIQIGAGRQSRTTSSYLPLIWLELIYRGGQHGTCAIEIPPQEMIAQSILEAHTAFRLRHQS